MRCYVLIFLYIIISLVYCDDDDIIVTLPNGKIEGHAWSTLRQSARFYAFLGIPYAEPPVGNLRFMPPQPVKDWDGVLETKANRKYCYQVDTISSHAAEDCLFINVYTPVEPDSNASLPVMINIYGGTFIRGASYDGIYAPMYVLEQNIVVVTFNYRVGPFGFLSTLDTVVPGNMGLKDQQLALKWVQENIQYFGGDPAKVTLMGQSAGSASVTYQLLSPGSKGLFRAAIGQSGSALCTWAHQRHPLESAYGIAAELDPSFSRNRTSQELLEFLQSVDADTFYNTTHIYKIFSPVIEVEHDGAFLTESMYTAADAGRINIVPVLMGMNSEEGLSIAANTAAWTKIVRGYDTNPETLVDEDLNISDPSILTTVGELIRLIYTDGPLVQNLGKAVQYFGDNRFMRPIMKFAELISQHTDVHFYQFSYSGPLGKNKVHVEGADKVTHAEDLNYFWLMDKNLDQISESDMKTLDRYVALLTNFAKGLDPTPVDSVSSDLLQNVTWPKMNVGQFAYLDLDTDLTIKEQPRNFSYLSWVALFEEYAGKPFISF